jgi:hypothetical protein
VKASGFPACNAGAAKAKEPAMTDPNQVPSPYEEPLTLGFPPAVRPPRPAEPRRNRVLVLVAGVAVVAIASLGIGLMIGSAKGSADASSDAPAGTTSAQAMPSQTAAAGKSTPRSSVLLALHGTGTRNSASFTTSDEWTVHYTYDCANFGDDGKFAVTYYTDGHIDDVAVNDLGKKGAAAAAVHADPGAHYLNVSSPCAWTVRVTSP